MCVILGFALRAAFVRMNSSVPVQLFISDSVLGLDLTQCVNLYIIYNWASLFCGKSVCKVVLRFLRTGWEKLVQASDQMTDLADIQL